MRKIVTVLAFAAALVLPLTACDPAAEQEAINSSLQQPATTDKLAPPEQVNDTPTAEAVPTPTSFTKNPDAGDEDIMEMVFITVLDEQDIHYSSEADALKLARMICDGLDQGYTPAEIGLAASDSSYTPYEVGFIIGASVRAFCPEYSGALG